MGSCVWKALTGVVQCHRPCPSCFPHSVSYAETTPWLHGQPRHRPKPSSHSKAKLIFLSSALRLRHWTGQHWGGDGIADPAHRAALSNLTARTAGPVKGKVRATRLRDSRTRSRRQAYFLPASTAAEAAAIIEPRIPLSAFSRPSDAASQAHSAKRPRPRECLEVTHAQRYTWPQPIIILHKRRRERAWPRLLGSFVLSLQLLRRKPWKSSFMCSITLYS